MSNPQEYKQVFVINKDLIMGKGKIGVQIGHAVTLYMDGLMSLVSEKQMFGECGGSERMLDTYSLWVKDEMMKKIVLKATGDEIDMLTGDLSFKKWWYSIVYDAGLTQVEPNSLTCLVTEPLTNEQYDEIFKEMKLL